MPDPPNVLGPLERPPAPRHDVLTTVEFDVLWEQLGLGPTPVVLRPETPGRSPAEHRHTEYSAVAAAGWQGLRERGLAGPGGPDPELVRRLHLLARPTEALELRAWWGRSVRALAAGRLGHGVVALRQDSSITLASCGHLPSGLVAVLPAAPPGPGRARTVSTAALSAALTAPGQDLRGAPRSAGVAAPDAALLGRMLGRIERRAQIVALVTDRWGVPRRAGGVVGVLDSARGRYLVCRGAAPDGSEWSTVAPIDEPGLRDRVAALLTEAEAEVRPGALPTSTDAARTAGPDQRSNTPRSTPAPCGRGVPEAS